MLFPAQGKVARGRFAYSPFPLILNLLKDGYRSNKIFPLILNLLKDVSLQPERIS